MREEQQLQEFRNRQALATADGEAREKKRDMQHIIHELMVSERSAQEVLASHVSSEQTSNSISTIDKDITGPTFQSSMVSVQCKLTNMKWSFREQLYLMLE